MHEEDDKGQPDTLIIDVRGELATEKMAGTARISPRKPPSIGPETFQPVPASGSGGLSADEAPRWRVRLDVGASPDNVLGFDLYGPLTLGRGQGKEGDSLDLSDFNATLHGVSRDHLELRPTPHNLFVLDLGSTNGTYLNGVRLEPLSPTPVTSGATILLGALEVTLYVVDAPAQDSDWYARQASLGQALTEMVSAAAEDDMDGLLAAVLDHAIVMVEAQGGALWLYEPDLGEAHLRVAHGLDASELEPIVGDLKGSLLGEVIQAGGPRMLVPDESGGWVTVTDNYEVESGLLVPLKLGDETVGVLCASNQTPGAIFGERDLTLLASMAHFAALGVANVTSLENERRRALQMQALYQTSLDVSSSLELPAVMDALLRSLSGMLSGALEAYAFSCAGDETSLIRGRTYRTGTLAAEPDENVWAVAHNVKESGQLVVVRAMDDSQPSEDAKKSSAWRGSYVGLPLRSAKQLAGVLVVRTSHSPRALSPNQMSLLGLLCAQAATAIENASLYRDLGTAYEGLQQADRLKEEMIQNVAHELRTPLTYLMGYAALLLDDTLELGPLTDVQRDGLEVVLLQSQKLSALVDTFIAASTAESSASRVEMCDVGALLAQAAHSASLLASESGVSLTLDVEDDLPQVLVSRLSIAQVIDNLVANSLKFTPEGGSVTLQAGLDAESGKVMVSVTDSGIGIPMEERERIFQRFYQVDGTQTRRYSGVGLGLAVCADILRAHGEAIWVEASSEVGTTICFTLPVRTEDEQEESPTLPLEGLKNAG